MIVIKGQSPTFTLRWVCRVSMRRKLAELRRTTRDPRSPRTADSFRTSTGSFCALLLFTPSSGWVLLLFYLRLSELSSTTYHWFPVNSVSFSCDELSLRLKHPALYDLQISRLYGLDIPSGRKMSRLFRKVQGQSPKSLRRLCCRD